MQTNIKQAAEVFCLVQPAAVEIVSAAAAGVMGLASG